MPRIEREIAERHQRCERANADERPLRPDAESAADEADVIARLHHADGERGVHQRAACAAKAAWQQSATADENRAAAKESSQ